MCDSIQCNTRAKDFFPKGNGKNPRLTICSLLSHAGFNYFLVFFYVGYCAYYYLRVKNLPTRKYAQPKTTVNIQPRLFYCASLKVLASPKQPQRSDGSTIPIDHTSLFPPPIIYIYLAAHNAFLCNPPASLYYSENFTKSLNFNLMGCNFCMCIVNFVDGYVLKLIVFLICFSTT